MAQQKNTWTIILVIIVLIVIAGGIYLWQTTQKDQEPLTSPEVEVTESETTISPQFDTMENYLTFSLESESAEELKTSSPPNDFLRIKIDNEDLSIAPKGVDFFNAYVWATSDWDDSNLEDLQTFYIETVQFDLTKEEEGVSIMETAYSTWYGPFQGKLKLLVQ